MVGIFCNTNSPCFIINDTETWKESCIVIIINAKYNYFQIEISGHCLYFNLPMNVSAMFVRRFQERKEQRQGRGEEGPRFLSPQRVSPSLFLLTSVVN